MKIVKNISVTELTQLAEKMYGTLVKADVDIVRQVVIVDMDMHADGEAYLLEEGSQQTDLWGINLHPSKYGTDDFIEFDSMINIKPRQGNSSRDILNPVIRQQIASLVEKVVYE